MINDEKLFFEAVRYTLEEMSPPERDAFEQRLADDQDAREAVAYAVGLCEMAAAALDEPALDELTDGGEDRRPREYFERPLAGAKLSVAKQAEHRWRRPAAWAAMALAASVLVAVVVAGIVRDHGAPNVAAAGDAERQLAVAWANSPAFTELSDDAAESNSQGRHDEGAADETDDANFDSNDTDGPSLDLVPTDRTDWLLEALTASQPRERSKPTYSATRGEG